MDDKLINRMCIAAAGIISKNAVEMSNLNWKITSSSLRKTANIDKVMIINDLQAQGYALDFIKPEDFRDINQGKPRYIIQMIQSLYVEWELALMLL